jgi:hypothetical protein
MGVQSAGRLRYDVGQIALANSKESSNFEERAFSSYWVQVKSPRKKNKRFLSLYFRVNPTVLNK